MHLYDIEGNPVYKVPYAGPKKGMRDATLRDARKLNLLPSVTEVLNIIAKPALNRWLEDRVLESALTMTRNDGESDESYIKRIKHDSKELSLAARNKGSDIHDAIESAFKDRTVPKEYIDMAYDVKSKIISHTTVSCWKSEVSFGHGLGYGGRVDLSGEHKYIVLDIKTKEVLKDKMAYDEQIMQLAAYSNGIYGTHKSVRHINAFVSWSGEVVFHEWGEAEIQRGWDMFKSALTLWQLQKRYVPEIN